MTESRQPGAAHHGDDAPTADGAGGVPGPGLPAETTPAGSASPALDEALDRLSLVVDAARAGWWEWNTATNAVTWSPEIWALFDVDPRSVASYEAWRAKLYPDDVGPAEAALAAAIAAGDDLQLEWRVRTLDGSERWLMTRGRPKRGAEGRAGVYVGIVMDVTDLHQANEARRSSEELLAKAFRSSPAAISVSRISDGVVLDVNEAWERLVGVRHDEAVGRALLDLGIYADPEARRTFVRAVTSEGRSGMHEALLKHRSGELRYVILAGERIRVGGVECVLSVLEDVTARRRAEAAVRESERRFHTLFADAVDPYFINDFEGRCVDANWRACEGLGYDREELLSLSLPDIHPGFDLEAAKAEWARIEPGRTYSLEGLHRRKDGSTFPVEIRYGLTELGGQKVLLSLARDVTERVEARRALEESEARYRALLENASDPCFVHDAEGRFVEANRGGCEALGFTREELLGMTVFDIDGGIEPAAAREAWSRLEPGRPITLQTAHRRKDGSAFPVEVRIVPAVIGGQEVFIALCRDITERVEAERRVREQAERLRAFFDSPVIGTLHGDVHGRILSANDEFLRIVGYSREDLEAGRIRWDDLTPPEFLPLDWAGIAEAREKGSCAPYEKQYVRKDGSRIWILVGFALVGEKRDESVAFILDISTQKAVTEALAASEERFRALFDRMGHGVVYQDHNGWITDANPAAQRILGLSLDQMQGRTSLDPRWRAVDEHGEPLPGERHPAMRALATGQVMSGFRQGIFNPDRNEMRWLSATSVPEFRPGEERPFRVFSTFEDVTERTLAEAEVRELNVTLEARVRERTEELEGFSYSVSHDLRAPLRAIDGFTRILEEDYAASLNDEGRRLLGVVRRNTRQMGQLIDDLLAFARVGRAEMRLGPVDMNALVRAAWGDLGTDTAGVVFAPGPLPPASGDAGLLRQVWVNLFSNAVKFSARLERPRVAVAAQAVSGRVTYSVSDNGAGFDPAFEHKLFRVFQRLHSPKEFPGTGVGLALVERIVRRHGGTVSAEGRPGAGATFRFSLPSATED